MPDENRRAKILLKPHQLVQLLGLPSGYEVERVYALDDPMGIAVVVSSDELAEQPDDVELPIIDGSFTTSQVWVLDDPANPDSDGKVYMRWGWQK